VNEGTDLVAASRERRFGIESDGRELHQQSRRGMPETKRWHWARRQGWTRKRWERAEEEAFELAAEDETMRLRGES
jgi:hypothetical protein